MKQSKPIFSVLILLIGLLSSCAVPEYLGVSGVAYQSLQLKQDTPTDPNAIPKDAKIAVFCSIDKDGNVDVFVENKTDKIMTIDRTKSFFQNRNCIAQMYYDPTVQTNTTSTTEGSGRGVGVNLGAIASAVGIGGILGTALSGVSVGGSNSSSVTNTNTTCVIDQPKVSIPPHGRISLGRTFQIQGVGKEFLQSAVNECYSDVNNVFNIDNSYAFANICVSYSIDEEQTYQFIENKLYASSLLIGKVKYTGKVNDALRSVYINKPNALTESWYLLYFASAKKNRNNNHKVSQQLLLNYQ